jgi:hypothetical protein
MKCLGNEIESYTIKTGNIKVIRTIAKIMGYDVKIFSCVHSFRFV